MNQPNGEWLDSGYQETVTATSDTRLAAILMVFGAQLRKHCPLEWVDVFEDLEQYSRYLEELKRREQGCRPDTSADPKSSVSFNFEGATVPMGAIIAAINKGYPQLNAALGESMDELPKDVQKKIMDAVSCLIARACHDTLLNREFLVKQLKRVPVWAKWDHIKGPGKKCVRIGKRSSPELRASLLFKLTN